MTLETWQWVLAGGFALVLAWWAHLRFWVGRLREELPYDETHRARTPDGCEVVLRRLRGEGVPVLMVHGIAANHRNVDARADRSLARHLHAEGRDVWLLTLRSGRADLGFVERRGATFAAMRDNDLPTGVAEVLARTGADALDLCCFSMGGMLVYASLGRTLPEASVRRVAVVGSPGKVIRPFGFLRVAGLLPRFVVPPLPLRFWARTGAFAAEWIATPFHRLIYNPDNVEPGTAPGSLVNIIESIPGPLAADFGDWLGRDGELRIGEERVLDGLRGITTPVTFIAGAGDRIAPPEAVKAAAEAWGCDVRDEAPPYRVLGEAGGQAHDYGHGDLVVGRDAEHDVFEPVAAFLRG